MGAGRAEVEGPARPCCGKERGVGRLEAGFCKRRSVAFCLEMGVEVVAEEAGWVVGGIEETGTEQSSGPPGGVHPASSAVVLHRRLLRCVFSHSALKQPVSGRCIFVILSQP